VRQFAGDRSRGTNDTPRDEGPGGEDTARIDLREVEARAAEADRLLLLLSIGAAELPRRADSASTRPSPDR
jgi:hypothetical protein